MIHEVFKPRHETALLKIKDRITHTELGVHIVIGQFNMHSCPTQ